jgi:hypothetical protein
MVTKMMRRGRDMAGGCAGAVMADGLGLMPKRPG